MMGYRGTWWRARKDELPEDGTLCVFHIKGRKPVSSRGLSIMFGTYHGEYGFFNREDTEFYPDRKVDYWMPIPILPEKEPR